MAKKNAKLLRFGIVGTVIVALCCFTPILVVMLGAVGLAALTGYLDYVLFPALGLFVAITIYALVKHRRAQNCGTWEDKRRKQ